MDENCRGYFIVNDYNINYWCNFSLINKILILTKKSGDLFFYIELSCIFVERKS